MVKTLRQVVSAAKRVRFGASGVRLTGNWGIVAVAELVDRLDLVGLLAAVGRIKCHDRATDIEVYGRQKRGVAYDCLGQRCGRPDVAVWA